MDIKAAIPSHLTEWTKEAERPKNAMGKDDFMKLLMAQLSHQDPLNPLDHREFSTQLAQFSQLEQLSNIGTGIKDLHSGMDDQAKVQALSMIGKKVQALGSEVELIEGQPVSINFQSKPDVQPVKVSVFSPEGRIVREIDLKKNQEPVLEWDGKSQDGQRLPSGKYSFRVYGVGKGGQSQEIGTELSGKVTGVDMVGSNPALVVQTASGSTRLDLSKVSNVTADEAPKEGAKPGSDVVSVGRPPQLSVERPVVASAEEPEATEDSTEAWHRDPWMPLTVR